MPVNLNAHVRIVKTVKIKADNDLGFMIINQSDFDEKKHKLFDEKPKRKKKNDGKQPASD